MCYVTCWYRGEKRAKKFAIPRIWPQPTDHSSNCYFYVVDAPQIVYPDIPSSIAPVLHCPELPVPTPPEEGAAIFRRQQQVKQRGRYWRARLRFHRCVEQRRPYFANQKDVNYMIRDLGLTKSNSELLISRLKQWNLLDESVRSEKASRNIFQLLQSARWAVLLQQCGRSI